MPIPTPSPADIVALVAYLPRLYADGLEPVVWQPAREHDGVLTLGYPGYAPVVQEFITEASRECWCDQAYVPAEAGAMLEDEDLVRHATLEQIKTMLTYCVRGERFCDGHWAAMIENGHIRRLLTRLGELAESA